MFGFHKGFWKQILFNYSKLFHYFDNFQIIYYIGLSIGISDENCECEKRSKFCSECFGGLPRNFIFSLELDTLEVWNDDLSILFILFEYYLLV